MIWHTELAQLNGQYVLLQTVNQELTLGPSTGPRVRNSIAGKVLGKSF